MEIDERKARDQAYEDIMTYVTEYTRLVTHEKSMFGSWQLDRSRRNTMADEGLSQEGL